MGKYGNHYGRNYNTIQQQIPVDTGKRAIIISTGKSRLALTVELKSATYDTIIPLADKTLKLIMYRPRGVREIITDNITVKKIDGKDVLRWYDVNYDFDVKGLWSYAAFADVESPYRDTFWVT